jgi:hypothetical protein
MTMTEKAKSELLKEAGEYDVMMIEPYWEAPKDDDKVQLCLVIPCHTNDDRVAYYRMYFSNKLAASGRNSGRTMFEINAEQCIDLGMATPFDPARISDLDGKTAYLVMAEDTYQGKTTVKPKWLNPQRAKKLDAAQVKDVWAKLTGGKTVGSTTVKLNPPKPEKVDPSDDLPFG